jgi:starch phosphorylase
VNTQQLLDDLKAIRPGGGAAELHSRIGGAVMRAIAEQWEKDTKQEGRQACYLSMEYLIGRVVFANLMNLGVLQEADALLKSQGVDLRALEDVPDAALGNGGLGRLAACYLESAATKDLPLGGYGLRYKYGLFRQEIRNGFQAELPDDWQKYGDPWSMRRDDAAEAICFSHCKVAAVPYDMPVIGYGGKRIGRLRLWQAEGEGAIALCDYLYPDDCTDEGRRLRIMQEYLLSSASLQSAVREYMSLPGADIRRFAESRVFQLNDTHPVLAIPELVRILTREHGMSFEEALSAVRRCFAYTNHTIMAEALESWDLKLMAGLIPCIVYIIRRIDKVVRRETVHRMPPGEAEGTRIVQQGRVHMARLAAHMCGHVNGVAEIHTGILKSDLFRTYEALYPGKILNVTNGVTQRRWMGLANPLLSGFITERIGGGWLTDLEQLSELRRFEDAGSVADLNRIKRANKQRLAEALKDHAGLIIDPDALLDVQIKRLHEYKRQLMNALSLLYLYFGIKDGEIKDFTPTTTLFGAKAAGSYIRAKGVIKLIHEVGRLIAADKEASRYLRVVFVPDYNVTWAERIVAAAEVSEQISLAGTEASGTGNMKLALNGAVTLGTMDGALVEIVRRAGAQNNYIFGMNESEVAALRSGYDSRRYLGDPRIRRVVEALTDGTLDDGGTGHFADLYCSLTAENDRYMVLADLQSYIDAKLAISRDYVDCGAFGLKGLRNIAAAGYFSSDRAVLEYARSIWHIERK